MSRVLLQQAPEYDCVRVRGEALQAEMRMIDIESGKG